METWVEELPKKKFFSRVNTTECLVTISMLVSNRIDTVEKCFESFRPLFEWCDDFAAARNAGLKEARGKWLIYLDDDEWFDDAGPLIDFFSKPELYENYDRVSMMEHSYTSAPQIEYGSSSFSRITVLTPEAKFVNPVH